ncbi:MAG: tripartite tricarboxylate transporter substrate-binding protein, partial [Proteobacteria bacterium]|nr:tripartite tricarboxylate transporter substrate-binding protein [Pseudomonadota bacterium]
MRRTSATAAFILLCSYLAPVSAADWIPTKPMRLVVPVVGGTVDILARLVAPRLQDALGQPVIVENKPGAGGNSGTDFVAKSPADGHTLLVSFTAPITVNPTLFQKLPYDPQKDLAPIMLAVSTHQFLVVHPSVPAKTVPE